MLLLGCGLDPTINSKNLEDLTKPWEAQRKDLYSTPSKPLNHLPREASKESLDFYQTIHCLVLIIILQRHLGDEENVHKLYLSSNLRRSFSSLRFSPLSSNSLSIHCFPYSHRSSVGEIFLFSFV